MALPSSSYEKKGVAVFKINPLYVLLASAKHTNTFKDLDSNLALKSTPPWWAQDDERKEHLSHLL